MTENPLALMNDDEHRLRPYSLSHQETLQLAHAAVESGIFKNVSHVFRAYFLVQAGAQLGLSVPAALNNLYIVPDSGRIGMEYKLVAALINDHPRYDYEIVKNDGKEAWVNGYRISKRTGEWEKLGPEDQPATVTFSMQDAEQAGLAGRGTYRKYPRSMLLAKALQRLVNWYMPEITMGGIVIGHTQEVQEIEGTTVEGTYSDIPDMAIDPVDFLGLTDEEAERYKTLRDAYQKLADQAEEFELALPEIDVMDGPDVLEDRIAGIDRTIDLITREIDHPWPGEIVKHWLRGRALYLGNGDDVPSPATSEVLKYRDAFDGTPMEGGDKYRLLEEIWSSDSASELTEHELNVTLDWLFEGAGLNPISVGEAAEILAYDDQQLEELRESL